MTKFRVLVRTDTVIEVDAADENAAEEAALKRFHSHDAKNTDVYVADAEEIQAVEQGTEAWTTNF